MLRDMTIGQFYPAESVIHRLDPRVKVVGVLAYLISLFLFRGFVGYAVVTVFLGTVIVLSKVPLRYIVRGMKPILFLLIVTALFNLFGTSGDVVFHWKFITITWQGIRKAVFMSMRLSYLIVGSSMMTYTTTPNQLTDAIEKIVKAIRKDKGAGSRFCDDDVLGAAFYPDSSRRGEPDYQCTECTRCGFRRGQIVAAYACHGIDSGAAFSICDQTCL